MSRISINCDMGESFGIYRMGDDKSIMPLITHANVACGFHASDPNHMKHTVMLAKQHNIDVGAHFSLPDLQGFGRREMKMSHDDLLNCIVYQIGALGGFLKAEGMKISHLKPHGALYGMAAKYEHVALAVTAAAKLYELPVFGMVNTLQEEVCKSEGVPFVSEFFADLDYGEGGQLIITQEHSAPAVDKVINKVDLAIREGKVKTTAGTHAATKVETICVHSDTPNVLELAKALADYLQDYEGGKS